MQRTTRTRREGIVAGLIGASAVALWFLVVDLAAGEPFRAPRVLGLAAYALVGGREAGTFALVAGYTVLHYAAFLVIGSVVARMVASAERTPALWAGLFLLFVVFEAAFFGASLILSSTTVIQALTWYHITGANAFAAVAMGTYLLRHHQRAPQQIDAALAGDV